MVLGPIKNPSEIAIEIIRERAIKKCKQASIRGADATQNGNERRGQPKQAREPAKPTQQADVGHYSPRINVQPSGEAETKEKKPSQHPPKRQNIILLLPTSKGANLPKPREWQKAHPMQAERAKRKAKGKKYANNITHFKGWAAGDNQVMVSPPPLHL